MKIAEYLVKRLEEIGIRKLFTVPGDYTLALLDYFLPSRIELVGNCNELNAAYAADGYARVNGVGALCVTYCVGGLSALNGVAGSNAERVPVDVVTGGPSRAQRAQHGAPATVPHPGHAAHRRDRRLDLLVGRAGHARDWLLPEPGLLPVHRVRDSRDPGGGFRSPG